MRDFDSEYLIDDREFKVGGEVFKWRYVRPEVIAAWEDEPVSDKSADALRSTDDRIKLFLDASNGAAERWDALRAREDNPVTMGELNAILMWLVEVQTDRPTQPPS